MGLEWGGGVSQQGGRDPGSLQLPALEEGLAPFPQQLVEVVPMAPAAPIMDSLGEPRGVGTLSWAIFFLKAHPPPASPPPRGPSKSDLQSAKKNECEYEYAYEQNMNKYECKCKYVICKYVKPAREFMQWEPADLMVFEVVFWMPD